MDFLINIINELTQIGFIFSIIFILYYIFNFSIRMYGKFRLKKDTRFEMSNKEKIWLALSIAMFFAYLI